MSIELAVEQVILGPEDQPLTLQLVESPTSLVVEDTTVAVEIVVPVTPILELVDGLVAVELTPPAIEVLEVALPGLQGLPGAPGAPGVPGPPGPVGGSPVTYTFSNASMAWTVSHTYPYRPEVETADTSGNLILGDVTYPSSTQVSVEFGFPMTGTMTLR